MKKFNFIRVISTASVIALILSTSVTLSGCRKKTVSESGANIVKSGDGQSGNYEVLLDERSEDTQYQYGEDDLSLLDTITGKKITLGMKKAEIEEITGEPELIDRNTNTYDGIVIKYDNDIAVMLSVSDGVFNGENRIRYSTLRGVHIGTPIEDFKKAYGSDYSEGSQNTDQNTGEIIKEASRATRYFKKDGKKIKFLGTKLTPELKSEDTSNYYLQDFMFSNKTGNVATIRVGLYSAVTGGLK